MRHFPGTRASRESKRSNAESFDPTHTEPVVSEPIRHSELLGCQRREHAMPIGGRGRTCSRSSIIGWSRRGLTEILTAEASPQISAPRGYFVTCLANRGANSAGDAARDASGAIAAG
jgi:hypothetical protein